MPTALTLFLSATLLAFGLSNAANAQSGRPSEAPADHAVEISAKSEDVGSYARYLMLNGRTREEAVRAAWNIDHPAPSKHFALRGAKPGADAASRSVAASSAATSR